MKTVIVAVNSKYVHSSLAPWYLKASCDAGCGDVKVMEFTINESPDVVLTRIYKEDCDVAAFSCYIWNIEFVHKICGNLKKVSPNIKIIYGGPEVSYCPQAILRGNSFVDYVISGEAEITFNDLLLFLNKGIGKLSNVKGLSYKKNGEIIESDSFSLVDNLDLISSPYTKEMLSFVGSRIIYFESSRGCPFSCSYCISSTFEGIRYFSMARVKSELKWLMSKGIKLIKFVDRTFNCNKERAKDIFKFIIDNVQQTMFHFEIAADLLDEEMLELLSRAPKGLIQFEIGVQSTNQDTLAAVRRKTKLKEVLYYVNRLVEMGNIHIHVDLIAGLPLEGYDSFKSSFDDVFGLKAHNLQMGFLKMLKGSSIRKESALYGYRFRDYPPYEVLGNKSISFREMTRLKEIEEVLERYHNSSRFIKTLEYVIENYFSSPFVFFETLAQFYLNEGCFERSVSGRGLYTIFLRFLSNLENGADIGLINELLKFDFLASNNTNNLPDGIERIYSKNFRGRCFEFLKYQENVEKYLPKFSGMTPKKIFTKIHFELFNHNVLDNGRILSGDNMVIMFNYDNYDKVLGHYEFAEVIL